jgi:hypothetical protein
MMFFGRFLGYYVMKSNGALPSHRQENIGSNLTSSAVIVLRHIFHFTYGPWIRTKVGWRGAAGHSLFLSRMTERKKSSGTNPKFHAPKSVRSS